MKAGMAEWSPREGASAMGKRLSGKSTRTSVWLTVLQRGAPVREATGTAGAQLVAVGAEAGMDRVISAVPREGPFGSGKAPPRCAPSVLKIIMFPTSFR
jgi:hypothetical protein